MTITVPVGSKLLNVYQDLGTYYVDVLSPMGGNYDKVGISAYMDNGPIPDDVGKYLGSVPQIGTGNRFHFFEFGGAL